MNRLLKDKTFKRLLRKKQRLETLSMLVPFVGVICLFLFTYLFSQDMLFISFIVLATILLLIILNYLFEGMLSDKIDDVYIQLNTYFQTYIVPRMLERDNPTITFEPSRAITPSELDRLEVFNCYKRYNVRFHFDVTNHNNIVAFDEIVFDGLVNYSTMEYKEVDENIDRFLNYHVYRITLPKPLAIRGMVVIGQFKEILLRNIQSLKLVDFYQAQYGISDDVLMSMFVKDGDDHELLLKDKHVDTYNELYRTNRPVIIDLNDNQLTIVFEEYANLINTPHSRRFTLEKLIYEYRLEKKYVQQIIKFFTR